MLPGGSQSKGKIACLFASCALIGRWALLTVFAAALVFSAPLLIIVNPSPAAHTARKAPRIAITKAKALSVKAERLASTRRATGRQVLRHPSPSSMASASHDGPKPIFRPLRC